MTTYEVNGETGTIEELCDIFEMPYAMVRSMIQTGYTPQEIFRGLHPTGKRKMKLIKQPKPLPKEPVEEITAPVRIKVKKEKPKKAETIKRRKTVFVRVGSSAGYYQWEEEQ